ncbi:MAG: choice-of-anchor J domain-containing protein [Bacteroidota bacterium]
MIKKVIILLILQMSIRSFSQVLYSEKFSTLTMNTGTYTASGVTQTYLYADAPSSMVTINNGNLIADTLTGNYPFRATGQKQKGWLAYKHPTIPDTFAVSTSWVTPQATTDSWLITPTINNIGANTVLVWDAMAPDITNADGYEVYITTNVSTTPVISDFTVNNRLFSTGAESSSWATHGVSLSGFAGQDIRLAFRNTSSNKYQLWIDDIMVKNVANNYDVAAFSNDTYKYSTINTNNSIMASFKNNGAAAITSLDINYQIGNNTVVTETQNLSTPLNYQDARQFTFSALYSSPLPGYNTVKIWVSAINGQADQVNTNDTVKGSLTILSSIPAKKVLVEEFTSAKCAICPDGYSRLSSIVSTYSNVIATSVHSNDNVTNSTGSSTLTAAYADQGSSAMIDRYIYAGAGKLATPRNAWEAYIVQRQSMVVPADVSITGVTYNQATHEIAATVSANFAGDVKGDYRINLYIKENNIYGPIMDISDNSWNQYSSLFNIHASPYYQVGYYLNPTTYILGPNQYSHQYVVTDFLDGAYGASGIVPVNDSTAGQSYSKNYTYTLSVPAGGEYRFNPDNIYLVGVVSEYNGGYNGLSVLNAKEVKLTSNTELPVGIQKISPENNALSMYPNPASDYSNLSYTSSQTEPVKVDIYNTLGELVYTHTETVNQGNVLQQINCSGFAEGNYHVVVSFKEQVVSKKLTVIK